MINKNRFRNIVLILLILSLLATVTYAITGLNIKQGSLMTLKMKSGAAAAQMPDTVYLVLHFDSIMNTRDSGIEIFE